MSWFSETLKKVGHNLADIDPTNKNSKLRKGLDKVDFNLIPDDAEAALHSLAMPLAKAWKDDHPNAKSGSESDFNDCVTVVAAGVAAGGAALGASAAGVGAIVGAAIGAGAGVPAARIACRRIL